MKKSELIKMLQKIEGDPDIVSECSDCGMHDVEKDDVIQQKVFLIWHSDYNNNRTPYVDYGYEKRDFVYTRNNLPDYVCKTVGEKFIITIR